MNIADALKLIRTAVDAIQSHHAPESYYVQIVPDHCDRVLWRNSYIHLEVQPNTNEPIPNVVLRDNLPTLLQEKDIKMSDTRLYTKPPQVNLTEAEIAEILASAGVAERNDTDGWYVLPYSFARAIEKKLKEKSNG